MARLVQIDVDLLSALIELAERGARELSDYDEPSKSQMREASEAWCAVETARSLRDRKEPA